MSTAAAGNTQPKLVVRKVVSADRERVFDAWTKPELMSQWLNPSGGRSNSSNDLRVGGKYSHEMIVSQGEADCEGGKSLGNGHVAYPHTGEYIEITRPERLVFTWNSVAVQNTKVTVDLRELNGGTEVTITHEFLPDTQIESHTRGWQGCLDNLQAFLR